MNTSLSLEPMAEEAALLGEHLRQGLAEMDHLFELMARDQTEIDRLAISSQAKLFIIRATFKRTDAILATFRAA